jgi:glycosyltransferase involved in cell wall biosynthesis
MKFSVIVPAHNEEALIRACLESIKNSAKNYADDIEVIVALNRCTDRTKEIARKHGAITIKEDRQNLAAIRNTAARAAAGKIIVTIDADSRMSANMLEQIDQKLASGKFIGGGMENIAGQRSTGG